MRNRLLASCMLMVFATFAAHAQLAGTAFTYQGQLLSGGSPASGDYDMRFRLFDSITAGTQLGPLLTFDGATGDPAAVTVTAGQFTVGLDFGNQFTGAPVYLQIATRPHSTGSYTVLSPRQLLTPAPYSMGLALPISTTISAPATALSIVNTGGPGMSLTALGGDGLDSSSSAADGNGILGICNNGGAAYGVWGSSTSGFGVVGSATGSATGGFFSTTSGFGVLAQSTSNDPTSMTGAGIYGVAHAPCGVSGADLLKTGIWGDTDIGNGVVGTTASSSTNSAGVLGLTNNTAGSGVFGIMHANTGLTFILNPGVRGESDSGHGVLGATTAGSGAAAVLGYTASTNAIAVYGDNTGATGNSYGVVGVTHSSAGYAGFFDGRMAATGTKSFQIDHPLDPENKYLFHYCTESPEPQNAYNGIVVTDAAGDAGSRSPITSRPSTRTSATR